MYWYLVCISIYIYVCKYMCIYIYALVSCMYISSYVLPAPLAEDLLRQAARLSAKRKPRWKQRRRQHLCRVAPVWRSKLRRPWISWCLSLVSCLHLWKVTSFGDTGVPIYESAFKYSTNFKPGFGVCRFVDWWMNERIQDRSTNL